MPTALNTKSNKSYSIESIKRGINRHLKNLPYNKKFDKGPGFIDSNANNFKAVLVDLKKSGKGDVPHYPHHIVVSL